MKLLSGQGRREEENQIGKERDQVSLCIEGLMHSESDSLALELSFVSLLSPALTHPPVSDPLLCCSSQPAPAINQHFFECLQAGLSQLCSGMCTGLQPGSFTGAILIPEWVSLALPSAQPSQLLPLPAATEMS